MRVLVTGSEGYIGSVLVAFLRERGHQVLGLDSGLFKQASEPPPPGSVRKDIRAVSRQDLEGLDAIIHLAALCNDPLGALDPEVTDEINRAATVRLAALAKDAGLSRFLFASSCSVYGAATGSEALDEHSPVNPLTPYARSKAAAEHELAAIASPTFSPISLRCGTAYGASPSLRTDLVLNDLAAWAHTTGRVRLRSDGAAWRPLVHVEDIAAAYAWLLSAPREKIHNQVFNVGRDDDNYRIRDLASIVSEAFRGATVELGEGASTDARSYRVSFARLKRTLPGLKLTWDARAGARQLRRAYIKARLTREELEGGRYARLPQLLRLQGAPAKT